MMEDRLMIVFLHQIELQCEYVHVAHTQINVGLNMPGTSGITTVFYGIQNLLTAAANISKALWGQGGKLAKERKRLRDALKVMDGTPLHNVAMRNNFEHYDERLDRWWKESKRHNIADRIIGPANAIQGLDPIEFFRAFDPKTTNVRFWGEQFNIQAIVDEVIRIAPLIEEELDRLQP